MQWMHHTGAKYNTVSCHQHKHISCQRYLQVSTGGLIKLDAFEQSLEVASAEALMVVSLDDLNEDCGTILKRLGEDLKKISIVIVVNENLELLQNSNVLLDLLTKMKLIKKY